MVKPRVHETTEGILGEFNVEAYDRMLQSLRDRGWMETGLVIKSGIQTGHALEIGPGPGYLGLEWLKKTVETRLTGVDISPDMISRARNNAEVYGLADRVEYVLADARRLPFDRNQFDGAFSNGSLHEWDRPEEILREIVRVLRPGGSLVLSDLRRDMLLPVKWFLWMATKPKTMRQGLLTSIASSYTPREVRELLADAGFSGRWQVSGNPLGVVVRATKLSAG